MTTRLHVGRRLESQEHSLEVRGGLRDVPDRGQRVVVRRHGVRCWPGSREDARAVHWNREINLQVREAPQIVHRRAVGGVREVGEVATVSPVGVAPQLTSVAVRVGHSVEHDRRVLPAEVRAESLDGSAPEKPDNASGVALPPPPPPPPLVTARHAENSDVFADGLVAVEVMACPTTVAGSEAEKVTLPVASFVADTNPRKCLALTVARSVAAVVAEELDQKPGVRRTC